MNALDKVEGAFASEDSPDTISGPGADGPEWIGPPRYFLALSIASAISFLWILGSYVLGGGAAADFMAACRRGAVWGCLWVGGCTWILAAVLYAGIQILDRTSLLRVDAEGLSFYPSRNLWIKTRALWIEIARVEVPARGEKPWLELRIVLHDDRAIRWRLDVLRFSTRQRLAASIRTHFAAADIREIAKIEGEVFVDLSSIPDEARREEARRALMFGRMARAKAPDPGEIGLAGAMFFFAWLHWASLIGFLLER